MAKVLVEVGSDTARFGAAVQAESIQHAAEVVKA
jgi:hypothetical protein